MSQEPIGILELDRFTAKGISRWLEISRDLDELHNVLYYSLVPERKRYRQDLLKAISSIQPLHFEFDKWVRTVSYQRSDSPLSCAGSLHGCGGRFNIGIDLDESGMSPWPALYIGADHETAYREKFQLPSDTRVSGLTPEELALQPGGSHTSVLLRGRLQSVFDMRSFKPLNPVARVLARIKMPEKAIILKRRLSIPHKGIGMIRDGSTLYRALMEHNWRRQPIQFGLPAPTHIIAELVRAAGFEAILYRSTKSNNDCLAIYPDQLASNSYIELVDGAPQSVIHARMDENTAPELCGWDSIPRQFRPAM